MSAISLRIPTSLHQKIREITKKDHVSINQFVNSALAEKISAFMSAEYLEERAKRGNKGRLWRALSKVKNVPPEEYEQI